MLAIRVGGMPMIETMVRILNHLVLGDADHADHGVEQELHLFRQVVGVVVQRGDVVVQAAEAGDRAFSRPPGGALVDEADDAAEAEQRVADVGGLIAQPPDLAHAVAQSAFRPIGLPVVDLIAEGVLRQAAEARGNLFQRVGQPIDHLLGEAGEGVEAGRGGGVLSANFGGIVERRQLGVADRHQMALGEHEAHGSQMGGSDLVAERGRHAHDQAVGCRAQSAGGLDLFEGVTIG